MSDAMRSLYDQLEIAKRARLDASLAGDAAAVLAARHGLMRHGERHPRARLSEETIRTVRALRAGGALHREIAAAVGVARSTISSLLGGRSWRHPEAQHAVHGD